MLTAYFDESYNHPSEKRPNDPLLYTVGCWLSTDEEWRRFGKKWRSALNSVGLESFHMKDYESRFRDYADWPEVRRIGFLKRLHRIMKEHIMFGVTSTVNRMEFDEVMNSTRLRSYFGATHYGFGVMVCMKSVSLWCEENSYDGPVSYVFAELAKQGSVLDRLFKAALSDERVKKAFRLTDTWRKGLMREVVQLQAADVIAYEMNKRAVNHIAAGKKFVRKSLDNLYLNGDHFSPLYFGEYELRRWIKLDGLERYAR